MLTEYKIILAVILIIIIGLIYLIFRWLNKIGKTKTGLMVFTLIFLGLTYLIYTALNPTDGFYIDEFETNSGLEFPESGKVKSKSATYPDQHGDYSANALFELNNKDFLKLINQIQNDSKFQIDTDKFSQPSTNFQKHYLLKSEGEGLVFKLKFNMKTNSIEMQRDSW